MIKTSLAVLAAALLPALAIPAFAQEAPTATPIKHVIVVIGENVSFDALYGVYQPAAGEHIRNLLSQKFINADGTPGPDYAKVVQNVGTLTSDKYTPHAVGTTPYAKLPQPLTTGILLPNFTFAAANPDARFASLAVNGPYQVTSFVPYSTAATGDPVHRFFQMYQQTGGSNISTHLPQRVVAIDVSNWFLDQAQGLRGVDRWGWWCFAVNQPVQYIENVGFGGHSGLQRQFYGLQHNLFVMVQDQ